MSDDQAPINIVNIDARQDYAMLRPSVEAACNRPRGAFEVVAALSALIGDVIGTAPTEDLRHILEEDAHVLIKKHIVLTALAPKPSSIILPVAGGRH
jgi:hypothetical protein